MIEGVPFLVLNNARRRYPSDPARGTLPCTYSILIVHTNRSVSFDNPSATFRRLPFQSQTSQTLVCCPWPHKPPKILLTSGSLSFLNPESHQSRAIRRSRCWR